MSKTQTQYMLDATQRQYLLNRIAQIEQDLINLSNSDTHSVMYAAAKRVASEAPIEDLVRELLYTMGYRKNAAEANGTVAFTRPLYASISAAGVEADANRRSTLNTKQAAIRKECTRIRDMVALGTLDENPATILLKLSTLNP